MAFSDSNLLIGLGYDLTNSPKDFNLTDNTDYSALTYSQIYGVLRAVDPTGNQFYNNTDYNSPDINYNSSHSSAALGSLPLDSSNLVKLGNYSFTYSVKIVDMLQSVTIVSNNSGAKTLELNGNYVSLIQAASADNFNCVDSVTTALTIVSATYDAGTGLTTVTVGETLGALTALAQFQFTVDRTYSKTFTQSYSYQSPSVCLNWVSDDCCSSMTITDVTTYFSGATVTRLHTVSYPIGISPAPADITSPLQELTITPIWTGTWVDVFTADISATDGIITITDSVRGVKEHNVSSEQTICQVSTCLANMSTKYNNFLVTAPQKALEMAKYINQASAAYMAYTTGKRCGTANYTQYLDAIFSIASECGCGCSDCNDCDQTPTQIVGCCENVGGSDFTIVIQSNNGSMTVTSNTVGTTTTFNIEVTGSWLTTQIINQIAVTDIGDLANVDDTTLSPATGQVLVWNNGTGKYERALPQVALLDLTDVDGTGLANNMVLYYDSGTQTFKFKLVASPSIATCTDVTLVGLANGQILKYNSGTTKWENVNNYLSLLGDVNTTGIANGSSIKWDTGTSKWIIFAPKLTLASLDDVSISGLANGDRFYYVLGTGWVNIPLPTFTDAGVTYRVGYSGSYSTFDDFGYAYDPITGELIVRGVINTGAVGALGAPVIVATLPAGAYPLVTYPFICTVGIGVTNALAVGDINPANGNITIYSYMDPTNPTGAGGGMVSGVPAGNIVISSTIRYRTS